MAHHHGVSSLGQLPVAVLTYSLPAYSSLPGRRDQENARWQDLKAPVAVAEAEKHCYRPPTRSFLVLLIAREMHYRIVAGGFLRGLQKQAHRLSGIGQVANL